MPRQSLPQLLTEIRACRLCAEHLPLGPRPILAAKKSAKIVIIGQAPGIRVHESGIPWNDPSGVRLRHWMGVGEDVFYDEEKIAIVPMGFCYPGTGKTGDMPPRPECAELWHGRIMKQLSSIKLTLLLGQYSQNYVLGDRSEKTLTLTVENWKRFKPNILPMPHPSPRNNRWLKKNPWFETDLLPWLKRQIKKLIG